MDGDDAAHGAVYRDSEGDIPLSRRPKEFLQFTDSGTVRRSVTGADDRAQEVDRAAWNDESGHVVFQFPANDMHRPTQYRIVEQSSGQLIVHRQ